MAELDDQIAEARSRLEELEAARAAKMAPSEPPQQRRDLGRGLLLMLIVLSVVGVAGFIGNLTDQSDSQASQGAEAATSGSADTPPLAEVRPIWRYGVVPDAIRGEPGSSACMLSSDKVALQWPYESQPTELCIRRSAKHGLDVYLRLTTGGQFICDSYSGCRVTVRFDEGKPVTFTAGGAADYSSDVIFIRRSAAFLEQVRKAKVTRIEAVYYEAGQQVSTFPTEGLDASAL